MHFSKAFIAAAAIYLVPSVVAEEEVSSASSAAPSSSTGVEKPAFTVRTLTRHITLTVILTLSPALHLESPVLRTVHRRLGHEMESIPRQEG